MVLGDVNITILTSSGMIARCLFAAVASDALEHAAVSLPNADTGVRVLVSDAADRRHGDVDNYTVNMSDVVSSMLLRISREQYVEIMPVIPSGRLIYVCQKRKAASCAYVANRHRVGAAA